MQQKEWDALRVLVPSLITAANAGHQQVGCGNGRLQVSKHGMQGG